MPVAKREEREKKKTKVTPLLIFGNFLPPQLHDADAKGRNE
jgi:hypothetical protein